MGLLAIHRYLLYRIFIVHTDEDAVRRLHIIQEQSSCLMRGHLRLAKYNFRVM